MASEGNAGRREGGVPSESRRQGPGRVQRGLDQVSPQQGLIYGIGPCRRGHPSLLRPTVAGRGSTPPALAGHLLSRPILHCSFWETAVLRQLVPRPCQLPWTTLTKAPSQSRVVLTAGGAGVTMCKFRQPKLLTEGPFTVVLLDEETDRSSLTFQVLPACLSRTQPPGRGACSSPAYWGRGFM